MVFCNVRKNRGTHYCVSFALPSHFSPLALNHALISVARERERKRERERERERENDVSESHANPLNRKIITGSLYIPLNLRLRIARWQQSDCISLTSIAS
jgi:hypothetical protein